jgi:hypothetical protein
MGKEPTVGRWPIRLQGGVSFVSDVSGRSSAQSKKLRCTYIAPDHVIVSIPNSSSDSARNRQERSHRFAELIHAIVVAYREETLRR